MKKKKNVEGALAALEGAEIQEIAAADLEAVAGGTTTHGVNGNCSCPAGSTVPPGTWTNGNCTQPRVIVSGLESR